MQNLDIKVPWVPRDVCHQLVNGIYGSFDILKEILVCFQQTPSNTANASVSSVSRIVAVLGDVSGVRSVNYVGSVLVPPPPPLQAVSVPATASMTQIFPP